MPLVPFFFIRMSNFTYRKIDLYFQKYTSPRHRMMTCTSGINDSLVRLSPSVDNNQSDNQADVSFHVMQNRPP